MMFRPLLTFARESMRVCSPIKPFRFFSTKQEVDHLGSYDTAYEDAKIQFTEGDPGKREFTYFLLGGARFIYASLARVALIKVVASLSASADVLALASAEFDLSEIEEGKTIIGLYHFWFIQ